MRMLIYKKISAVKTEEDAAELQEELTDRFSDPPRQVLSLITIALIKAMAEEIFISEINDSSSSVTFFYFSADKLDFEKISAISNEFKGQILINAGNKPGFSLKIPKGKEKDKLFNIKKILQMLK